MYSIKMHKPHSTFDEGPFVIGVLHVNPADALIVGTQPVNSLLIPVVIQREHRPAGGGQKTQGAAVGSE